MVSVVGLASITSAQLAAESEEQREMRLLRRRSNACASKETS